VRWLWPDELKPSFKKDPYTHGEDCIDHRAFPAVLDQPEGEFLGRSGAEDAVGLEAISGSGIGTVARPVCSLGQLRAGSAQSRTVPQRLLLEGVGDALWHHPTAHCACSRQELSSPGNRKSSAPELALLIREAFLRGISTRQVGRIVATVSGETISAQTVSRLTRDLDEAVRQFHQAPLKDEWAYLFLDGVNLKVRRPAGRQCVQMLVAYGVRQDKRRELLAFLRTQGESQADWEALLQDLYRSGLKGDKLLLIVTDGCPGLAAAIQTVYPRVAHQRCWVHKMRNILDKVRKRDHDAVKADAQAIYLAEGRRQTEAAARIFCRRWRREYPTMVRQLERDLPDLLAFYRFPKLLWRKLRTTNVIERCFVEVRRRTRPMVCFVNVQSVDRIIYSIFQRFNLEWKNRTLRVFTQAA
jgi:putative transposase